MTHAAASETHVSSMARSAPVQYGLDVSASQKMWVSKLASTRRRAYFTSATGSCHFTASRFSVPFFLSFATAARSPFPSFVSDLR